ncbi:hypothetical protein [Streptomyces sp. NPDC058695]|uniref:hypothetical protein n=1 Tax=Streptomyces sp. NPDC058695 TaxID=3346604 RepID=UPI00365C15E0
MSAKVLILVSLGCLVVGDLGLPLFPAHAAVAVVALPMIVTGAGTGLSAGPVDGQALALVPPEKAGMAAGFVNTLRLGGEAVAGAVYGSLLTTLLGGGHTYNSAFHGLLWGLAAVSLGLGAVRVAVARACGGAAGRPGASRAAMSSRARPFGRKRDEARRRRWS